MGREEMFKNPLMIQVVKHKIKPILKQKPANFY